MPKPTLSVIVATMARPSLDVALQSIAAQPDAAEVEAVIVVDSRASKQREVYLPRDADRLGGLEVYEHDAGFSCWGHPQRNYGMQVARGTFLAFLDDDDVWTPDALRTILAHSTASISSLHVFRMQYANGDALWREPRIAVGNVGTPMMVIRNDPELYGQWGRRYEGDLDFCRSTSANLPAGPSDVVWHPEVIALIRPGELT